MGRYVKQGYTSSDEGASRSSQSKSEWTLWRNLKNLDFIVLCAMIFLLGTGFSIIYSITSVLMYNNLPKDPNPYYFVIKQGLGVVLGVVGGLFVLSLPYKLLKSLSGLAFGINIVLLIITLLIGGGPGGVRSWIDLGPLSLQPAELVKIGLVLAIAWFISNHRSYFRHLTFGELCTLWLKPVPLRQKFKRYFFSPWGMLAYTALVLLLIMLQPDLGTGLIVMGSGIVMVLCSGLQLKTLRLILIILCVAFGGVWSVKDVILHGHQLDRLLVWKQPFAYEKDLGYQNIGGYTAIALGGLEGSGLGNGIQKYGYVAEPHNDFVVSIVAEELGVLWVLLMIGVYFLITIRIMSRAFHTKDMYASLVCIGLGSSFVLQVIINLGGVSGTIPLTGVTLPFVSYGGTSVLTTFLLLAVYFNVNSQIREENKAYRERERLKRYEEKISVLKD